MLGGDGGAESEGGRGVPPALCCWPWLAHAAIRCAKPHGGHSSASAGAPHPASPSTPGTRMGKDLGDHGGKGAVAPRRTLAAQTQGRAPPVLPRWHQPCRWLPAMPGEDGGKVPLGLDAKGGFGAGRWELLGQEMKVAATGRRNAQHGRGSTVAGVPSRHTFPTRGRCTGGASGAGPLRLSGLVGSRSRAHRQGGESWCLRGCRGWAAVGRHTASPLPRHSLAAGLPWEMALVQHCSAAGQLGPARRGGTDPGSRQHRSPGGAALLPLFSLPSLPPCAVPSPLPRPAHRGDCVLDGDTDPCQSQLGEINTPGLKGLCAPGGGERAVTHGLPARRSRPSMGRRVPEQPTGSARPGTACSQPEPGSGARLAVPHCLPRPEPCRPGGTGGRGVEMAPPTCCPARGCGGGLC